MKHYIKDNIYTIIDDNEDVLLTCELKPDFPNYQVVIKTKNEVFAGPIDFISFSDYIVSADKKENK